MSNQTIVAPADSFAALGVSQASSPTSFDRVPVIVVGVASIAIALFISISVDVRQAVLFLIGMALGVTLLHASFGFSGGWRRMLLETRSRSVRAQMIMVGLAAIGFFPLLAASPVGGQALVGALAPVGFAVAIGAAMFGIGMQLAGGCGSGTLFSVGGGSKRMLVTLAFFVIGAFLGTAHLGWWLSLPSLPAVSLVESLGAYSGLAVTLVALALVYWWVRSREIRKYGNVESITSAQAVSVSNGWRWLSGPWPLLAAAVILAVLNIVTLLVAGHPWSITYAFGLWGAKIAQAAGMGVAEWPFWQAPYNARALSNSVLADNTSVMNFGLMLGSALAACLAGKFAIARQLNWRMYFTAALGGLLMGYGARVSFGCNVGALFSGIASGSLHGWLWFACAFAGSWFYVRFLRLRSVQG